MALLPALEAVFKKVGFTRALSHHMPVIQTLETALGVNFLNKAQTVYPTLSLPISTAAVCKCFLMCVCVLWLVEYVTFVRQGNGQ